jgi:hypothetical protein
MVIFTGIIQEAEGGEFRSGREGLKLKSQPFPGIESQSSNF